MSVLEAFVSSGGALGMRCRNGLFLVVGSLLAAACSGSSPGDMIQDREGHTATLLENGLVLVVGGRDVGTASSELYDPAAGWSVAPNTLQERVDHTATLLSDGRVLVAGSGEDASAEVYDPSTSSWTLTGSMQEWRIVHTATLLRDGRVLVVGGGSLSPTNRPLVLAEVYDPVTGAWSNVVGTEERDGHTATLLSDGRVLIVGGQDPDIVPGDGPGPGSRITSAEVYDPSTNAWSSAGPMLEPRADHTATLLDDGRVLVVGGRHGADELDIFASVEVFDPATGVWSAASAMEENRTGHTATLLDGGRVLVVGGIDEGNHTYSSTEIYNPSTGSWTESGEISKAREGHSATLLADGKVLIAGGCGDGGVRPALTEVFDPATNSWMPAAQR